MKNRRRAAVTYVITLIFLVLFSVLALGFYASSTTAIEIAKNDVHTARAQLAAESGLAFFRYHLGNVTVPSGTSGSALLSTIATQLSTRLNSTANLNGDTVGSSASAINIPNSSSHYIGCGTDGAGFRGNLTCNSSDVILTVTGRGAGSGTTLPSRGIQITFRAKPSNAGVLNYGVVTNGSQVLGGGIIKGIPDSTRGTFFSTSSLAQPLKMSGSALVSNKVYFSNPTGTINGSGGTIGGVSYPAWTSNVIQGVPAPEFPSIDTTAYANYMATANPPMTLITGDWGASSGPLSNIRVKAGCNAQFTGGCTISGLIYIEMPNQVTFSGGPHITGVIVVDKPNDTSANWILISGGGTLSGPENLPASYGSLRSMTGAAILAPNCDVSFTGGSCSLGGSIFVKSTLFSGGGQGLVNGSMLCYGTAQSTWSGGSGVTFTNTGPTAIPAYGVNFSGKLSPVSSTYTEIVP